MMKTKYGITETFLFTMVILALISVGLVGYFWIANEYERFKKEKITLKEESFAAQKQLTKMKLKKSLTTSPLKNPRPQSA